MTQPSSSPRAGPAQSEVWKRKIDGGDANRQAHDELRRALGEISRLDASCEEARRELRSGEPTAEERAAQLRRELEAEVQAAARRVATAQAEMVRSNLLVVVAIAKKYPGRGPDLPDLIQEGNIGLIRAVEKFDRAPPVRFLSTRSVGSICTPATTLVRPAGTSWMAKAGCRGATQIFFAPPAERPEVREVREAKARAICHTCPVMSPCRTWAREHREYGFWGGESEAERVAAGFRVAG